MPPNLSFVITTLGRIQALSTLLESIVSQLHKDDELIIVAQRNQDEVEDLVRNFQTSATVKVMESKRGACLGRNTGARIASGEYLIFPNDTTWFPTGSVEKIRKALITTDVLAYAVRDQVGNKFIFTNKSAKITYLNAWEVIEPGLAINRESFNLIGGFNNDFGPGAPSPWQAGEGADLLFRWQRRFPDRSVSWVPEIVVGGVTDSAGLSPRERRIKLRAYGRGCGHIMSIHKNPLWFRSAYVLAGFFLPLKRKKEYGLFDGLWAATGRFEGVTGIMFGPAFPSVSR